MKLSKIAGVIGVLFFTSLQAENLSEVYQLASRNDATLKAAAAQYDAAKWDVPIARAALLPALSLTANTTQTRPNPGSGAAYPDRYNSSAYVLTLTQPIFSLGSWSLYRQADIEVAQALLTFKQADQQLILRVATAYFGVLEAKDKLKYAQTYQSQLKEQVLQTEQQYKVGLKALTDYESAKASNDSAIAMVVGANNDLNNAIEALGVITGKPITQLSVLKENAPFPSPVPQDQNAWVNAALSGNLALQLAELEKRLLSTEVNSARLGNGAVPGYLPVVKVQAAQSYARTHNVTSGSSPSVALNKSAGLTLSYSLFNGGSTYFTVSQAEANGQVGAYDLEQTRRHTIAQTQQYYLSIFSDISQVEALGQSIVSGESALAATRAAYSVGTRTIVDLLTQQSNLLSTQQQYASARYQYILDSLNLKILTGLLSAEDVATINTWLVAT